MRRDLKGKGREREREILEIRGVYRVRWDEEKR